MKAHPDRLNVYSLRFDSKLPVEIFSPLPVGRIPTAPIPRFLHDKKHSSDENTWRQWYVARC